MRGELPSTRALMAFEAVARLQTLQRAAEDLCLSQSAVSKQLQLLEDSVGIPLFDRSKRRLTLTEAGARYAKTVREALMALRGATEALRPLPAAGNLSILVPPVFSNFFLTHRLSEYTRSRPEVSISMLTYANREPPDFAGTGADAAVILFDGTHDPKRVAVDKITSNTYGVPVCAPELLKDGQPFDTVEELAKLTWLENRSHTDVWRHWLAAVGAEDTKPNQILWFDDGQAAHAAARSGIGVCISGGGAGVRHPYLEDGSLVVAHPFHSLSHPYHYFLVVPHPNLRRPVVADFRAWLLNAF